MITQDSEAPPALVLIPVKKKTVPGGPISTLYQCHFKNIPLLEAL